MFRSALDDGEHLGLQVDRQHPTLRQQTSDRNREVPGSGSDVRDDIPLLEGKAADQQVGSFLHLTRRSLEPARPEVAHDMGDLTAHVDATGAIATRAALLVELIGWQHAAQRDGDSGRACRPSLPATRSHTRHLRRAPSSRRADSTDIH